MKIWNVVREGMVADLLACHARSVKNLVAWLEETLDIIMQLSR